MTETRQHSKCIPTSEAGKRLDRTLAGMFPEYSRARLQNWINQGLVTVDGETKRPRDAVFGGETVHLTARLDPVGTPQPQALDLRFAYEDDDLYVVDKPVGLVVHPGAGNPDGTLVNGLLHVDAGLAVLPRAGLIHRLDKDTSGLLLVARNRRAYDALSRAMADRRIKREYLALVVGALSGGGTIDAPVGRHPVDRKRMAVTERGRPARSHYTVERRFRGYTLLRVRLETGRTHQIRVHFSHRRNPLVGDPVYGRLALPRDASDDLKNTLTAFRRQALHAAQLTFDHPTRDEPLTVSCPIPADFAALLDALAAGGQAVSP